MNEICGDNRFEIIAKAKADLLDATNIDTSEDEMKVLDSFLFRCWQMGWLDRYDTADRKTEPTISKMEQVEDEPQTFDKPPKCLGCWYSDLDKAFHPCASCVDFGKYVGEVSGKDEPQTDCAWK